MLDGSLENPLAAAVLVAAFLVLAPLSLTVLREGRSGDPFTWLEVLGRYGLIVTWAFVAPLAVANHLRPETLLWLFGPEVGDGGLAEYATVAAWACAAILAARLALVTQGWERALYALAAAGAFVLFGEEISWGQWLFNWGSPAFFAENNLQSETNAHNFFPPEVFDAAYAIAGLIIAGLVGMLRFGRGLGPIVTALRQWPPARWIGHSRHGVPLAFSAAVLMQHHMFQEVAEMALSLAVLYALWWTVSRAALGRPVEFAPA